MEEISRWANQAIEHIVLILKYFRDQAVIWWNGLPQYHVAVTVFAVMVVVVTDYLFRAGKTDWAAGSKRQVVLANIIFVLVVALPIVAFFSLFVIGGKDISTFAGDLFAVWLLMYARMGMNLLTNALPRNRFLRTLGNVVILGLGGIGIVALMAPLFLPR